MKPIDRVIEALHARGCEPRRNGSGWSARCPVHADRRPSLSIREADDGRALLLCHAGCRTEAVAQALGLSMADLFDGQRARRGNGKAETFPTARAAVDALEARYGKRSALYKYRNSDGEPVGAVVRWDKPDGSKEIRPVSGHPDGWRIAAMPAPRPLYRLPEILEADPGAPVFVVEGEKACDAAAELGLLATTSAGGSKAAAKADWSPLAGRRVVILPDNDEPGSRYAEDVARILASLDPPARVRIVELPNLPPGGDVYDFIEARDSRTSEEIRAEIETLAESAPKYAPPAESEGPVVVRIADVKPEPVSWLWPVRIPLGKLTLIAGDPGLGKSLLTLDLAARVSRGTPWPDCPDEPPPAGGVVILSAEDDIADTVRPRLDAAGADCNRIVALRAVREPSPDGGTQEAAFCLASHLGALEAAIRDVEGCRLVVIDPVSAFLPAGRTFDSHRNTDVRAVLAPLAELAGRLGVAVVAVTHLRKGEGRAIYRAMGSLAFVAAARAAWAVATDPDDPRRRLMLPIKNNLAAETPGMAFTIETGPEGAPVVAWDPAPVTLTADEILGPVRRGGGEAMAEAKAWLEVALEDGPVPVQTLQARAKDEGIAWRTLKRAKGKLRVVSAKSGFGEGWSWALPEHAERLRGPEGGQTHKLGPLRQFGTLRRLRPIIRRR